MQIDTAAETPNSALPEYGSKPRTPGMYLGLFHGRHDPNEQMNDWGFNGPAIGPLSWCHTTYAVNVKIRFERFSDGARYFGETDNEFQMKIDGDLLVFNDVYYGDWTVYYVKPEDCEQPTDTFRRTTRRNDLLAHRKFVL